MALYCQMVPITSNHKTSVEYNTELELPMCLGAWLGGSADLGWAHSRIRGDTNMVTVKLTKGRAT